MAKLINGKIPAHTECPYKAMCVFVKELGDCHHKGKEHDAPYSCAWAHGYDIIHKNEGKQK